MGAARMTRLVVLATAAVAAAAGATAARRELPPTFGEVGVVEGVVEGGLFGRTIVADPGGGAVVGAAGANLVYALSNGRTVQTITSDGDKDDFFGDALAVSETKLLIGARKAKNEAGRAELYTRRARNQPWSFARALSVESTNKVEPGAFGSSVAVSESDAFVGAPKSAVQRLENAGMVVALSAVGQDPTLVLPKSPKANAAFGASMALQGDILVVGAPGLGDAAGGNGAVHVFVRNKKVWKETAVLVAPDGSPGDRFGLSVALNVRNGGSIVVAVGAPKFRPSTTQAGQVYVFSAGSGLQFSAPEVVEAPRPDQDSRFGVSVALHNAVLAVGASRDSFRHSLGGAVWLFTAQDDIRRRRVLQQRGLWALYGELVSSQNRAGAFFGNSVAMSEKRVFAGGHLPKKGKMYLFEQVQVPSRQPTTRQPTTLQPARQPSQQPTEQPSDQPTGQPSQQPTRQPSDQPTGQPTRQPSDQPTGQPSQQPTRQPSDQPTGQPTSLPTTAQPNASPPTTGQPTATLPTAQPSTLSPSLNLTGEEGGFKTDEKDGEELLGAWFFLLLICVLFGLFLVLALLQWLTRDRYLTVFVVLIAMLDFTTDALFAIELANQKDDEFARTLWLACVTFIALPLMVNFFVSWRLVHRLFSRNASFAAWTLRNDAALGCYRFASLLTMEAFKVSSSKLFNGAAAFSAPLTDGDKRQIVAFSLVNNVFEDIPQLVIVLLFQSASGAGAWSSIAIASLVVSSVSVLYTFVARTSSMQLHFLDNRGLHDVKKHYLDEEDGGGSEHTGGSGPAQSEVLAERNATSSIPTATVVEAPVPVVHPEASPVQVQRPPPPTPPPPHSQVAQV